ncbi:flippase-like domain-containing protein [Ferruginibacter lapsinanis]|uniref:lysylphosphatidylglycerol synthase transmembrane domain-containing protein n=1 Tax=Ferruginibacter lapsinanis TaxID=563172 RepID=UPI001E3186CF|nr:lysylphosphatidylglycerol synthase transmembrane domain-containing protein [Ferruginibacter lapsinanis]UEG49257.1 flippase-like domain-containing protein [Ferruginibacter lapsinanis]
MKKRFLSILQYAAFFSVGIFLVWWSIHKMSDKNWENCKNALQSARYGLFVPVFFILSLSHISRAIRWKILMKPLGYNPRFLNTFFAVMIGYLANLAIPRLGEVLKCTILGKYEKVPPDKLVGTIVVERAVDLLSLIIVFFIAIITQASIIGSYAKETIKENFLSGSKQAMLTKFLILVISIVVIYYVLKYIFKKYGENKFIHRMKNIATGIATGLASIKNLENKKAFIFHSVFIWCCYVGGTYLGFFATSGTAHLSFAAAFPVLAFASIGMIITPGGIGSYPVFIMEVMLLYNIEEGIGFANGNLQWVAQFLIVLIVGFLSLLLLPYYNKKSNHA